MTKVMITVNRPTETTEQQIEVDFPFYSQYDGDSDLGEYISYKRIEADGTYYEIGYSKSYSQKWPEYSFERGRLDMKRDFYKMFRSTGDYRTIPATKFIEVLHDFQKELQSIPVE